MAVPLNENYHFWLRAGASHPSLDDLDAKIRDCQSQIKAIKPP